jgi:hypothetical protein
MGAYTYGERSDGEITYYIDPGSNAKNDLKLALMKTRKEYGATHIVKVAVSKVWNRYTKQYDVHNQIVATPTASHQAQLEAKRVVWSKKKEAYEGSYWSYSRTPGPRKPKQLRKAPGRGKPELNELEFLEQVLSKPRCRYQRGWKGWYCPTRKSHHRTDDRKNWKSHRKDHWKVPAVSFRSLVHGTD